MRTRHRARKLATPSRRRTIPTVPADTLTYSLGGTDWVSFTIDRTDGQLSTKAPLDFEKKSRYTVTVKATDPSLESATITVNIEVTDVDEPPTETGGEMEIDYAEMGRGAVDTYTATDPEDDRARPRKPLTWSLSGNDDGKLSISQSGVLTFDSPPDYEAAAAAGTDNDLRRDGDGHRQR